MEPSRTEPGIRRWRPGRWVPGGPTTRRGSVLDPESRLDVDRVEDRLQFPHVFV